MPSLKKPKRWEELTFVEKWEWINDRIKELEKMIEEPN
jgi:hypothetical protein